jgi:hypothetical protein
MPRQTWQLANGRPVIEVVRHFVPTGQTVPRRLLADTGAGSDQSGFELVLDNIDCRQCGGIPCQPVALGGAYSGTFPVFLVRVQISQLGFDGHVRAVGVSQAPPRLDGIACFRFLNRFRYGNLGGPTEFGLET